VKLLDKSKNSKSFSQITISERSLLSSTSMLVNNHHDGVVNS
jgi:hypothetical protein